MTSQGLYKWKREAGGAEAEKGRAEYLEVGVMQMLTWELEGDYEPRKVAASRSQKGQSKAFPIRDYTRNSGVDLAPTEMHFGL